MHKNIPRPIRPTEQERQEAALFLTETEASASYLKSFTERFYHEHAYLMSAGTGVIAQLGQPSDKPDRVVPPVETLILDARQSDEDQYTWELTHGNGGGRNIWQVTLGPEGAEGMAYRLNIQGLLRDSVEMPEEDLGTTIAYINQLVVDPGVLAAVEAKKQEYVRNKAFKKTQFSALLPYIPTPPVSPEHVERVLAFWEEYRGALNRIGHTEAFKYSPSLGRTVAVPEIEEILINHGLKLPQRGE